MSPFTSCPIFPGDSRCGTEETKRLRTRTAYLPAILWAIVVLGIGSLHHVPVPSVRFPIDKVGHFGMYGVLGALTAIGWIRNGRVSMIVVPILLACSVGAVDEIHQRYVSGRTSDVFDFAADVLGVTTAFSLAAWLDATHTTGTE